MESRPLEITTDLVRAWLPRRPLDSHKGCFGDVGILGGAPGMAGAALLAGRAALRLGAGRVHVGLLDERIACDVLMPELMLCSPEHLLGLRPPGCLVAGPGLGRSLAGQEWLSAALATPLPLLVDADGLNLLAEDDGLARRLSQRTAPTLLTPHPGEAARLLQSDTAAVQANRTAAIQTLADRYQAGVVLKGAGSLVHLPDGPLWINLTGNPGLASPGMGDCLAGMIGALAAQGLDMERAALLGVHLHGAAADILAGRLGGQIGLGATEVAGEARRLVNQWVYG